MNSPRAATAFHLTLLLSSLSTSIKQSISSLSATSSFITVAYQTNYPIIEQIQVFKVGELILFNIWMNMAENSELINQLAVNWFVIKVSK